MVRAILVFSLLTACSIPLEKVGTLEVTVLSYPSKLLPGDEFSVEIMTDARVLEVALTLPEGVRVSEHIEGAVLVLNVKVDEGAAPGVRVITAELLDGKRYGVVTLGLQVIEKGAGIPAP